MSVVAVIIVVFTLLKCCYDSVKLNSYYKGYKEGYKKGYRYHLENKLSKNKSNIILVITI